LEYEKLFSEFIRSKAEINLSLREPKFQTSDSALSNTQISAPPVSLKSPHESPGRGSTPVLGPIGRCLLSYLDRFFVSVAVVWYLVEHRNFQPGKPLETRRQAIESELARLNTPGAGSPGKVLLTVNLQPAERYRGAMARVTADNTTPDALVEFRLSLTEQVVKSTAPFFLMIGTGTVFNLKADCARHAWWPGDQVRCTSQLFESW